MISFHWCQDRRGGLGKGRVGWDRAGDSLFPGKVGKSPLLDNPRESPAT